MKSRLFLILILLMISGCATVVDGEMQEITVETPGARQSRCILDNGDFHYIVNPPETINISNRKRGLQVSCKASGNRYKEATIIAKAPTSYYMNVLNGLAPGTLVDYVSGAMYRYPEKIVIDFTGDPLRPYPRPDYHLDYYENPAAAGMEEFRPGLPALIRDQYEAIPELRKKDPSLAGQSAASTDSDIAAFLTAPEKDEFSGSSLPSPGGAASLPPPPPSGQSDFIGGTATQMDPGGPVEIFPDEGS